MKDIYRIYNRKLTKIINKYQNGCLTKIERKQTKQSRTEEKKGFQRVHQNLHSYSRYSIQECHSIKTHSYIPRLNMEHGTRNTWSTHSIQKHIENKYI